MATSARLRCSSATSRECSLLSCTARSVTDAGSLSWRMHRRASRVPPAVRLVDTECSRAGFFGRAQSYPATQGTGQLLSITLHAILDDLAASLNARWTPWIGDGPLPSRGVVVVETDPTTVDGSALSMADQKSLPTRSVPRRLSDGTVVRAKSDWYWRSGAGELAAEMLDAPAVRHEFDHERVAGLWCLALAHEFDRIRQGGAPR